MTPLAERPRYAPGTPVDWRQLPALVAVPAAAALALGWALRTLYVYGWYLVILTPFAAGPALAGVLTFAVGRSRCRSRRLGGGVGLLSGLLLYFGYYHFCQLEHLPAGSAHRVDLLPGYVWTRLQTDVAVVVAHHPPVFRIGDKLAPRQNGPSLLMNVWTFVFEVGTCVVFSAVVAWKRSGRAFCEELGQWMKRSVANLPPEFTPRFVEAVAAGRLAKFVAEAPPVSDPGYAGRLVLEYVSDASEPALSFPVYVSAEDHDLSHFFWRLRGVRKTTIRQVELEPSEVLELRPLFPELARLLEAQHPRLREQPGDVVMPRGPVLPADDVAQISPVPEPYRRRVHRDGYALSASLRSLIPVAFFFGGIGLVAAGGWLLSENRLVPGGLAIIAGAPSAAWGAYTATLCMGVFRSRWTRRRLCEEIALRPDVLVRPDDPEACFVAIIPRGNLAVVKATSASDVLLLKIDRPGRQILLEGDSDRYRIPAAAVTACVPQMFFHPMDGERRNELWMARLLVRVEQGVRELLISRGTIRFTPTTNKVRRRRAEELCRQIQELVAAKG